MAVHRVYVCVASADTAKQVFKVVVPADPAFSANVSSSCFASFHHRYSSLNHSCELLHIIAWCGCTLITYFFVIVRSINTFKHRGIFCTSMFL